MSWGKKLLRVTAVGLVAFAAGHTAETFKSPASARMTSSDLDEGATLRSEAALHIDNSVPRSASLSTGAGATLDDLVGIVPVAATTEAGSDNCSPELQLAAIADAMISVSLSAPCNRGERIIVRHTGLAFAARTGADGRANLTIPALKSDAMVAVYLEGSRFALGNVLVPDVADFTRLALIWDAPAEIELRVRDGDKVLVGGSAPHVPTTPTIHEFGLATVQAPVFARVYSAPGTDLGETEITAELRINPETCGRTLRLEVLYSRNGLVALTDRQVAVPLCGTAGDILVLKNLAPTSKLAIPN
jgi:hypothetical protein